MNTDPAPSTLSLASPNARWKSKALLGVLVLSLAACGGGDGGTDPSGAGNATGGTGSTGAAGAPDGTGAASVPGTAGSTSPIAFSVSAITCTPNPATIDTLITCVVTGTALPTASGILTLNTSQTTGSGVAACPATWAEASTPVPSATAKSFTCTPQGQGTTRISLNLQAQNNGNNAGGAQTLAINSVYAVTTFAGSTKSGSADGTGSTASFNNPYGIALDGSGNVYVADGPNDEIRKITPAGVVTTFAGSTVNGSADGTGSAASFTSPLGVAVDSNGNVYVADTDNNAIRKITPAGVVTTFAGSRARGHADGTGSAATFYSPTGLAVDSNGNVYVADRDNHEIRKITPAGVVSTLAGSTTQGNANGTGSAASFYAPFDLAVDSNGNVYVTDEGNNLIRKITPLGVVSTLAGSGANDYADGTGSKASFNYPSGVAVDSNGNVYVADTSNNVIRKITPAGVVTTLAGSTTRGNADGTGSAASFNQPSAVAVDRNGIVYVGDRINNEIRKLTPVPGM